MQKTCFLIGFMGAGKTYWGQRLAERLRLPFIDLDARLEAGEMSAISAIFDRVGESGFRLLEQRYLHALAGLPPAIVATGGGAPCFFDNMDWMNRHGTTIYLSVPARVLAARLERDAPVRPLLKGLSGSALEAHIESLLRQRESFYRQATLVIDCTDDQVDCVEQILQRLAG